jgi:AAA+ ATPase superfamily predicted ATPase/Holliday junction resolvase
MFRTSNPVTGSGFFDRTAEIAQLEEAVGSLRAGSPRWLALLGGRKIGKTSLLLELTRRELDGVVVAVLDSFEERPLSLGIFRRLALRVADAFFSRGLGVSLEALSQDPEEYRTALVEAEGFALLPRELRATLLRLADATPDLRLAEISLGLAEKLAVALDKHCVVAWDEFQELSRLGGRVDGDVLALARAVWQRHVRTAYFICGSERTMLRNLVTSQRSPFFQHFGLIELGPMPTVAAVDLLVRSAPPRRPIPLDVARKAVEVLGGHPFYLQMFGETLTAKEPPYDSALLRQVFSEMLFSRTGRLSLYFANELEKTVGQAATLSAVLESLAERPKRLTEIAADIGAASGSTARYLERLGDAVVHRTDGLYELADPVFALWLRWRKPGGTIVPMAVVGDEAELEVARRLAEMGFELVYQSRASRGAFDLLGIRNGVQLGIQVKRSDFPLRFPKTVWSRLRADAEKLGWRFVLAAVSPSRGTVSFLSPESAAVRRAVVLDSRAVIDNLLAWLENVSRADSKRRGSGRRPLVRVRRGT